MRHFSWILLFGIISCCGYHRVSLSGADELRGPSSVTSRCQPSADPMACMRQLCEDGAGTSFNTAKQVCECPRGFILNTVGEYKCELLPLAPLDDGGVGGQVSASNGRSYQLYVNGPERASSQDFLVLISGEAGLLPLWNMGAQSFELLHGSESLRSQDVNPKSIRKLAGPGTAIHDFILQPPVNLYSEVNSGIWNATGGTPYSRLAFPAATHPIKTGKPALDQMIAASLARAQQGFTFDSVQSFTEAGCADQCVLRQNLSEDAAALVYRTKSYFSGVVVQDQVSIFDKQTRATAITIPLLNAHPNGFVLDESGKIYLHGNESDLEESRVGLLQEFPVRAEVPGFSLNANDPPVAVFEAAANPAVIPAIARGPFTETHVWGWFRSEDNLPYFKNYQDFPSQYGEEEIEMTSVESGHGITVSYLATDGYKHPLIPFASSDLLSGNFSKFLRNYRNSRAGQPLTASISESFALSAQSCVASPLGQAITSSPDVAWVVGAGNSGKSIGTNSRMCPQSLVAANLIHVAATSDEETLGSASTRGETTVEIADLGCAPNQDACGAQEAATSFAAPRVARKVSDLQRAFPKIAVKDVLFALLATARVPYDKWGYSQPLQVISGGTADVNAAALLLRQFANWPADRQLTSKPWQSLLLAAKKDHYIAWSKYLVREEAKMFVKRGGLK